MDKGEAPKREWLVLVAVNACSVNGGFLDRGKH